MGSSIQMPDRIWSSIKASFFSPFNGLAYYFNNKRTTQAEDFMSYVASDSSMRKVIPRIHVPTLLVYGEKDLVAPVQVGEFIYRLYCKNSILTAKAPRTQRKSTVKFHKYQ
jgi:pimeloyl-ACP methyl ester carboxylesterase